MPNRLHAMRSTLEAWQFGQLVVCFVLYLIFLPMLDHGIAVKFAASLLLLNALLVAAAASPKARILRSGVWALWVFSVALMMVEEFRVHANVALTSRALGVAGHAALVLVCIVSILSVVFRARRVTLDGILASVAAYQLIGFFFAQVYIIMLLFDSHSLQLPARPASVHIDQIEMIYFSYVTLSTLGYGDIVPHTSLARSIAVVEAMIGQFYVAVIVAVLVSAFVAQKLADRATDAD
jgi:Ion channel